MIIDKLLDLVYPPKCPLCNDLLEKGALICEDCKPLIFQVGSPCCLRCGCEIDNEEIEFCEDCARVERSFVRGFPALNYVGEVRNSITAFKYSNKKYYADFFASEIIRRQRDSILAARPEVLIPVPISRKRYKSRGYNQAELLANSLGRRLNIPVDNELIKRDVNTRPQKDLNNIDRERNLKSAFISTGKIVKYNSVMLVDDIYTTGATIEACTRVLMKQGIKDVYYTSICIGKGY